MDQQLLLYIMAAFTGVAALSLLLMLGMMFALYRSVSVLRDRTVNLIDRWEPALDEIRGQSGEILAHVRAVADSGHQQVRRADQLLSEISAILRVQMDRIDRAVELNLARLDDITAAMQYALYAPIRQARGFAAAAGAFFGRLAQRSRPTVDRATLDEEMFI